MSGMAARALRSFRGSTLVYVGEVCVESTPNRSTEKEKEKCVPGTRRGNILEKEQEQEEEEEKEGSDDDEATTTIVRDGATAGSEFHRALVADWVLRRQVALPHWPGAADSLTVWSRKEGEKRSRCDLRTGSGSAPAPVFEAKSDSTAARGGKTATTEEHRKSSSVPAPPPPSQAGAESVRRDEFTRVMQHTWEEAAVAHMVERARTGGGSKARPGLERAALDAVRSRSGLFRRLLLWTL